METGGADLNAPLDWKKGWPCGYSFSDGKDAWYIPTRHAGGGNIADPATFVSNIALAIKKHRPRIIGHNIKFDCHFSLNDGIDLGPDLVDTMTQAALCDENQYSYSLGNCCLVYDGKVEPKKEQRLYDHLASTFSCNPSRKSMGHFHKLPGNDPLASEYAAGDTLSTYQLCTEQRKQIELEELNAIVNLENELTATLFRMERNGIRVDADEAAKVKREIDDLQQEAYSNLPLGINVNSRGDLREYFEYCNITDWPLTAKGNPSFNKVFLGSHNEGEHILVARKLDHLKNSFLDPLERHIHNGKIHCNFNPVKGDEYGTVSGRLSSSNPNMQQIPKRDKFVGKIYRRMFIPDPDYILIELDYSQCEPRLYAHYSGEPILIEGYNSNPYIDMHSVCASLLSVSRDEAKNMNLGILYNMGALKLANLLGISFDEAKYLLRQWYMKFRRVSEFRSKAAKIGEYRGYVKTILGRRRRFPDPRWAYKAANSIIQGGSADILKYKMVELDKWIKASGLDSYVHMLLTIHDALVFQIHKSVFHQTVRSIISILENVQGNPFNLRVPFIADWKCGYTWADASYGRDKPLIKMAA